MINWLFSQLQRPERGWDPVPAEHAQQYGRDEWQGVNEPVLDQLEDWLGGLAGKRVLDLGGGPGHYTVAFARRGASVTWFDVSRNYQAMAQAKAAELLVADRVQFCLGYMDDASRVLTDRYDLVFNRICWNYGRSDHSFAQVVYQLVCSGRLRLHRHHQYTLQRRQVVGLGATAHLAERSLLHQDRPSLPSARASRHPIDAPADGAPPGRLHLGLQRPGPV